MLDENPAAQCAGGKHYVEGGMFLPHSRMI
jgi:hypothetical protein